MKIRYSERVLTGFPVIFASESFVGEGTVDNVSVPGCSIVSDKIVKPGTYLEMKVLMPDNAPSLCVELAKIRWRKVVVSVWNSSKCRASIRSVLDG